MKKIIFTLLVAMTIVATAQAKHESKSEPKKPTTEKSAEKAVEQQNDEQPQEAADENDGDKATGKVSFTKNGVIIKKDGKDIISDIQLINDTHQRFSHFYKPCGVIQNPNVKISSIETWRICLF